MSKKKRARSDVAKDLWVAPNFSLKDRDGKRAWDHRHVADPSSARFLELADIALGNRRSEAKKKKAKASEPGRMGHHSG